VAGAGYTLTLQQYDRWRLVGFRGLLTTDANAANRFVTVEYLDGQGIAIAEDGSPTAITASQTGVQLRGALTYGAPAGTIATGLWFSLSGLWRPMASQIKIVIAGVQVGDLLSALRFTFDRTLVPDDGSYPVRAKVREGRLESELGG
jgi:hypothetical protein